MTQELIRQHGGISKASTRANGTSLARWTNVVLGAWLFVSAFIWKHTPTSFTNTWIMGVIIAAIALGALAVPALRYVNTASAVYLFISSIAVHHLYAASGWHNAIVAGLVFLVSLVPSRVYGTRAAGAPMMQRRIEV